MRAGATAKEQLIVVDQYRVAWARCCQVTSHVNPAALVRAYSGRPDAPLSAQRVSFGTSGHRGSACYNALNEAHILAIAQAICIDRNARGIDGPLFIGIDTHALSAPALLTAVEVLVSDGVTAMVDAQDGYTLTPAISYASSAITGHARSPTNPSPPDPKNVCGRIF